MPRRRWHCADPHPRRPQTQGRRSGRSLERIRDRFDDPQKPTFVWQLDFAEVFHRRDATFTGGDLLTDKSPDAQPSTLNQPSGFDLMVGNPALRPHLSRCSTRMRPRRLPSSSATTIRPRRNTTTSTSSSWNAARNCWPRASRLAFILPHKFFNAQYGQPLRELLAGGRHLRHVVHYSNQQIFPRAQLRLLSSACSSSRVRARIPAAGCAPRTRTCPRGCKTSAASKGPFRRKASPQPNGTLPSAKVPLSLIGSKPCR